MPHVLLQVETRGHSFVPGLLESDTGQVGLAYRSGPVTVTWTGGYGQRAWGAPEVSQFVVEWAAGESLSVIAGWLLAKAHGKVLQMWINRREVRTDKDDILSVLREANLSDQITDGE